MSLCVPICCSSPLLIVACRQISLLVPPPAPHSTIIIPHAQVIAGKIIAAIATTTAAVCGLVMLELIKVQQGKPTDAFMNRQVCSLALVFSCL